LRAAAKNHDRVTVVADPSDYERVLRELGASSDRMTTPKKRRNEGSINGLSHLLQALL